MILLQKLLLTQPKDPRLISIGIILTFKTSFQLETMTLRQIRPLKMLQRLRRVQPMLLTGHWKMLVRRQTCAQNSGILVTQVSPVLRLLDTSQDQEIGSQHNQDLLTYVTFQSITSSTKSKFRLVSTASKTVLTRCVSLKRKSTSKCFTLRKARESA